MGCIDCLAWVLLLGYMVSLGFGFVVLVWWCGMFGLLACVC